MKKFLKSLGQLNRFQIDTVIAVANTAITENVAEATMVKLTTSNNSLKIASAMTDEHTLCVALVVDNEDVFTHIDFDYHPVTEHFSKVSVKEVPKPEPKLLPMTLLLGFGLSNSQ